MKAKKKLIAKRPKVTRAEREHARRFAANVSTGLLVVGAIAGLVMAAKVRRCGRCDRRLRGAAVEWVCDIESRRGGAGHGGRGLLPRLCNSQRAPVA